MKYQRYPAYKDSGIDWLGSIPTHWESLPLKRVSSIQLSNVDKKTVDDQQPVYLCNYVDVYKNERISANMPFMLASASDEQISRLSLKQGDVIITKDSESPDDIGVPALISEDLTGVVCGYHLALIRPETTIINGQFLFRFLQGSFARAQFSVEAVGMTRYGLSKSSIVDSKIITPPLSEQIAIATFLDREIAKIDALVAKQECLLALLQEKRQALISHAVTKGLNPYAPMKDSGVEWIGQIPAHWDRAPLKHLVCPEITDGPHETPEFFDSGYPFLSAEAVKNNALDFDRKRGYIDSATFERYSQKCLPQRNDILMVKSGNTTGALAIVETDDVFAIWSPLALIRTKPEVNPRFAFYCMSSLFFQQSVALFSSYGTQPNIGMGVIENLLMTVLPPDEQVAIVSYLDCELADISILISKVTEAIQKLGERRTALVSAAVTGKIDVRNLVNRKPL